jgi:hypothetical protein
VLKDVHNLPVVRQTPKFSPVFADIMTQGQRNQRYVDGQRWRSSVHLVPFFGNLGISEITAGKIQEYRVHRHQEAIAGRGKPPGHSTIQSGNRHPAPDPENSVAPWLA